MAAVKTVQTKWKEVARLAAALAAVATSVFIPPPAYFGESGKTTLTRLMGAAGLIVTALMLAAMSRWKHAADTRRWLFAAAILGAGAILMYFAYNDRRDRLTALGPTGDRVVIGSSYTPAAAAYVEAHPTATPQQLLEDSPCPSGGSECSSQVVWTLSSIEHNKRTLSLIFLGGTLVLIGAILAAVQCVLVPPAARRRA